MAHKAPFSPSFGNRPAQLVGRQALMQSILDGLAENPGSRNRALVLLGQRGSGKTVMLWEIAEHARRAGYVVANPTTATEGMLDRIIEKVQEDGEGRETQDPKASISGANLGMLGFSVGLQFTRETLETKSFHYKLRSLCKRLNRLELGVLVLVDELQANSPDMRQLVSAYQELVGEGMNIALVLAGLPGAVSGTLNDRVLTFLNRARKEQLAPLAIGEVDAYFAKAFTEMDVQISSALRRFAAEATEGSPYLLQLVGHYIALYAQDGMVTEATLSEALASARADFERDVCQTSLAALSRQDVAFLLAMAKDDGASRVAKVAERLGVSFDYAQKYRKRLIDAGVIRPALRGEVTFAIPYLRNWLQAANWG